ncbi:DUF4302 domain-containing protein [Sphingobacterium lactis]|uniref:DUF4302 domain-containing protein n=1 Tax=Sphingobacterium lactis TaxID=797291 RepID=UPI003F7D2DA4
MKKLIYYMLFGFSAITLFAACEKDNITNAHFDANPNRQEEVVSNLKKAMASSPNGWVMMVKSSLSADVYTPIVLQFDTVLNKVQITTVYGMTSETDDFFRVTKGTGSPQLIFTTGSIMSTLFRIGATASDITDHIYNVIAVSDDEIQIQPYRSGMVYSKEGGVIYKMFKRPDDWTWANQKIEFDWTSDVFKTNINSVIGEMKLDYQNDTPDKTVEWRFWTWSNPFVYQSADPFSINVNIGTGGFKPNYYFIIAGGVTNQVNTTVTLGHNAVSIFPFSYNTGTNQAATALKNNIKSHYLTFKSISRNGNNVKMEFEAYGKDGKVILKASYDNKR